jgi:multidrug efflux system outer membrane protein
MMAYGLRQSKAMLVRLLIVALLGSMSACALIHEDGKPAARITPDQVRLADDIHLARDGWPDACWWQRYHDPQLDALIEFALKQAPDILVARSRVDQARSQLALIQADSWPQVTALGAVDRERVSANGFLRPFALDDPSLGGQGPWYTEGTVGVLGSYAVDLWGKQRDMVRATIGMRNAKQAEAATVEIEISADVARLYFDMQADMQKRDLLQQASHIQASVVAAHEARAARGLEASTTGATARATLLQMEEQITLAQTEIRQLREILRALIGAGADNLPPIDARPLPSEDDALPRTLSFQLLARRPDLQAMQWYVQASFDQVEAAKAAFYPDFDIKAFFGVDSLFMSALWHHASQQINLIPGLTLPIFDGGRLNANLQNARNAGNTLIEQYNQAVLNAVRDVATAGNQVQGLDRQVTLQRQRLAQNQIEADDAVARYRRGLTSQVSASAAELPVLAQQAELVEIRGHRLDAEVALIKALGGGYGVPAKDE